MKKYHSLPNQFRIREKGTNVWLAGYVDGTPFYSHERAQTWLRKEVKAHIAKRDHNILSEGVTKAEVTAELDRYEIVEVQLLGVSTPTVQAPVFEQAHIDAYKDGYLTYNPTDWRTTVTCPYKGRAKDWWMEGHEDAQRSHCREDLVYPEIAALI